MSQSSSNESSVCQDKAESHQNLEELNQYLDLNYAKSLVENVLIPMNDRYFNTLFVGFDEMPERNNPDHPLIFISNHSGMAFPWDGMLFTAMLYTRAKYDFKLAVRPLAAPALSQSNLMNPYLIEKFWEINGAVEARFKNFEQIMHYQDSNILVYPEGVPGIGKGFNRRYQLQRFATSFVRMSLKYRTDVIPFATVNGEYINPYVLSWPWLNKLSKKIGIPYIPVGFHTILLIFLPWLFYYGLPAKLTYVMGRRIKPYEMVDKPYDELDDEDIKRVRDQIKNTAQQELDQAVKEHGNNRYSRGKIVGRSWGEIFKLFYYSPPGWPLLFHEHHRMYQKYKGEPFSLNPGLWSWVRYLVNNPITICYYLPVIGWIPLLIKGYRDHNINQ